MKKLAQSITTKFTLASQIQLILHTAATKLPVNSKIQELFRVSTI
jgi:hypothetical protein